MRLHTRNTGKAPWEVIGALASVIAIGLTIYGFYFSHHEASKQIEALLLSRSSLLNTDLHERPADLKLIFRDKEISNLTIFQVLIRNSGAQPILASEIEEPLHVSIGSTDGIISAAVVNRRPHNLPITPTITSDTVTLSRALLNPDDSFTVEIAALSRGKSPPDTPRVEGRIAGVKDILLRTSVPEATTFWSSEILKIATAAFVIANLSLLRSLDITNLLLTALSAAWDKFKRRI